MSEVQWTVREILQWTSKRLANEISDTPLLDAQLMLGKVLGLNKVQLYLHLDRPLSPEERSGMREMVQRRLKGEPVAYLLGIKHWHDLTLEVDARVLIPRPETETLLDVALALWRVGGTAPARVLDLCTGSGCLAIALARAFPTAQVVAVDVSEEALEVARSNAHRNGVENVSFVMGDVTKADLYDREELRPGFDLVVSNPPYVTEAEWKRCPVSVKDFEPRIALVAGEEGLAVARCIVERVRKPGFLAHEASLFLMELGEAAPAELARRMGLSTAEPFAFSSQHPLWELPRGAFFALRDLSAVPRFLTRIEGLKAGAGGELVAEALAEPDPDDESDAGSV